MLWAEPGAAEKEGHAHSKSQASDSRKQNFSVFQFSKIERIKQIRADVPTCNYQLISLGFKKKREKFQNRSHISAAAWWRDDWVGRELLQTASGDQVGWGRLVRGRCHYCQ